MHTKTHCKQATAKMEKCHKNTASELQRVEDRFNKACQRIATIDTTLDNLECRLREESQFVYNERACSKLRMKIDIATAIRGMYFEYALTKGDEVTSLRCQLYGQEAICDMLTENV